MNDAVIRKLLEPLPIPKPRARYMAGSEGKWWSVEHMVTARTYITTRPHDGARLLIESHLTPAKQRTL